MLYVALRKESVDRNLLSLSSLQRLLVALRKESVDRNWALSNAEHPHGVALRKESVDRNSSTIIYIMVFVSRSPQGERG